MGTESDSTNAAVDMSMVTTLKLKQLVSKNEYDRKKRSASKEVMEMVNYIIFLVLFLVATLEGWNNSSYKTRSILMAQLRDKPFLPSETSIRKTFSDVKCIDELYQFLAGPFYYSVYLDDSYDTDTRWPTGPLYNTPGFVAGVERIVGTIRIGQLRVKEYPCEGVLGEILNSSSMCFPEYSSSVESTSSFGYEHQYNSIPPAPNEPSFVSLTGRYYPSPRFAIYLPSKENLSVCNATTLSNCSVYNTITSLRDHKFIDKATRAIYIDFTMYNANTDQQSVVRLFAEQTMGGGLATQADCMTYRLYRNETTADKVRLTLEILVLLQVFYQLYDELRLFRRVRSAYWHMTANVAHTFSLFLFIVCAILRVLCFMNLPTISTDNMGPTSFVNFRASALYYMMADVATSFTCFLSWLKLFKFLAFMPMFAPLTKTVTKATRKVSSLILIFFITFLGSALSFNMAFGVDLPRYYSFFSSFVGLLCILQGELDLNELHKSNRILGPIFFVVFVTFMFFVILNMFIVVISDAYIDAKGELQLMKDLDVDTLSKEISRHILHNIVFKAPVIGKVLQRVYKETMTRIDQMSHSLRECKKKHGLCQTTHVATMKLLHAGLAVKGLQPSRYQIFLEQYRKRHIEFERKWTKAKQQVQPPPIEVVFLGTSSMMSSTTRNVSGIGVMISGETWIFDAGEGIGLQLSKSSVLMSSVTRIFVTHMHGDHVFGLMGLILSVGNSGTRRDIQIVGPPGLRRYLRRNFADSQSNMRSVYHVDELWHSDTKEEPCEYHNKPLSFERPGVNVFATLTDQFKAWHVPSKHQVFQVLAGALRHTLEPCFGYIIQEIDYPGRVQMTNELKNRLMDPKNASFLSENYGISNPMQALSMVQKDGFVALADGPLKLSDVTGPIRHGRRLCLLGDTCDSRAVAALAVGADLVVHECTNAYIPSLDADSTTPEEVEARTFVHGHSTPSMAARFAQAIQARQLVLTHFSRRYRDDLSDEMEAAMKIIKDECRKYFNGPVNCAHDLQHIRVPMREERTRDLVHEGLVAEEKAQAAAQDAKDKAKAYFALHPESIDGQTKVSMTFANHFEICHGLYQALPNDTR
ncbi:hypothetical protein THRCLA_08308 [Thraustotheca clavata]|uniref:Uncharacterized protein n=1 Tax=Thraustotheca clavata TaxID=74557 RepID=A0A1V9Z7D5_9STRA|nr:hypothetical protein THRCLA_08308 [Thraustotheca clavata]